MTGSTTFIPDMKLRKADMSQIRSGRIVTDEY
jgi:hypothetical protein